MATTQLGPRSTLGATALREWLETHEETIPAFAARAGMDRVAIQRLIAGVRGSRISVRVASQIEDATRGTVPMRAWLHLVSDARAEVGA